MIDSKYKVIFWDFDGVIMNSNEIRDVGFEQVLKEYPAHEVEKLMVFHQKNGGLSRYVKFRYFFEEIRGEEVSEIEINEWAAKFSDIMLSLLIDEKLLIEENISFISVNYKKYSMHIVSGSDQVELREISRQLGIDKYFKAIHGSPTPKNDLIKELLLENKYELDECVLIGDSINDLEAAQINQISFIPYNNSELENKLNYKR